MKSTRLVSILFIVAAVYDGVLGVMFCLVPWLPFHLFEVTPPNHWGYVQFPALLLVVFAIMFARIAMDPVANRNLIPYGILLKASYCGVVSWYWITTGIPDMWKPFAICDVVFGVLFWWAFVRVGKQEA